MLLLLVQASAQNTDKIIRNGNKLYDRSDYPAAELKYDKALETDPTSQKGIFNQGGAYYQQEKYEEALQNYEIAAEMLDDKTERAGAYHNLGNTYFKSQELEKSIEAYKNSLRLNPYDEDTRYNLALAQSMLQQQEQQQQDQNQDQQDQQDKEDQQDQQDQQDQGEDQNEEGDDQQQQQQEGEDEKEGDQEQQQNQQGDEGEEQQEQTAPQPSKLSKEEVQRLLESLANDENKVQEKIIKAKTKTNNSKIEKDW
jgi:tetratricopeptide (TPR) repeat protein